MNEQDHTPSDDAFALEDLGLDDFETGLLAVLRHFLAAFTRPETQAWQTAFALASERWGRAMGPQIAAGGLGMLQALRRARRREFTFANPLCPCCRDKVTGDEAALMRMIQAMRRDRTDLARDEVQSLTEGRMDPGLIQSAVTFAARHPAEMGDFNPPRISPRAPQPDGLPTPTHEEPSPRRGGHLRLVH